MGEYTTINPSSKEKRREHDLYPTPEGLVRAVLTNWWNGYKTYPKAILDPGCGEGVWGKVAKELWPHAEITGLDIRDIPNSYYDDFYSKEDFLSANALYPRDWQLKKYDLIIGNPPYGPKGTAEAFIRTAHKYLKDEGWIIFLLRQAFLASLIRYNGLWQDHFPFEVITLSRRPSFYHADTGSKSTDGEEYAVFTWRKEWKEKFYEGSLLNWEY